MLEEPAHFVGAVQQEPHVDAADAQLGGQAPVLHREFGVVPSRPPAAALRHSRPPQPQRRLLRLWNMLNSVTLATRLTAAAARIAAA